MVLTERQIRVEDAPAITELLRAVERAEPADEQVSEDEIVEEMTGPTTDLRRGSVAVLDGEALVAFGALSAVPSEDAWRAYLYGGVRPDRARRGLGTRVVRLLADQARAWRDADRPDLPGELKMWVPEPRVSTAALAKSEGFSSWRWFVQMRRELDGPVSIAEPAAGYTIRTWTDADSESTRVACNAAFADHWGSSPRDPDRWNQEVTGTGFRPDHSYLAVDGAGAVVGFVIIAEYVAETEAHGFRTGYVPLVGTVRTARGRGLASALLTRALASMTADGYRRSELTVDAESPTDAGRLYERLGYRPFDRAQVFGRRF